MERYPEAKVILTVRDPDRWYESTLNTIYGMRRTGSHSPIFPLMELFVPGMRTVRRATGTVDDLAWEGTFGGRFEDRRHAIEVFERLNEEVEERVPAERLLVYDVKEGWEPLCEFLGVEAPEGKPFPRLNDTATFRKRIRLRIALTFAALTGGVLLTVLLVLYLLSVASRRTSPT